MSKKQDAETLAHDELPEWQRALHLVPNTMILVEGMDGSTTRCTFKMAIVGAGPAIIAIRVVHNIGDEIMIPLHNVAAITPVKRKSA